MKFQKSLEISRKMLSRVRLTLGWSGSARSSRFTVLILPHSRSRFHKIQLSSGFILCVAGLLVGIVATALFVPHLVFQARDKSMEMEQLELDKEMLRARARDFQQREQSALPDTDCGEEILILVRKPG